MAAGCGEMVLLAEWVRRDPKRKGRLVARRVVVSEERSVDFKDILSAGSGLCCETVDSARLAQVEVMREATISLPTQYEGIRIGVRIRLPCPIEKIEQVRVALDDHAENVIGAQYDRVKKDISKCARWYLLGYLRPTDFEEDTWKLIASRAETMRTASQSGGV